MGIAEGLCFNSRKIIGKFMEIVGETDETLGSFSIVAGLTGFFMGPSSWTEGRHFQAWLSLDLKQYHEPATHKKW